ncbi:MAG: TolC family outer membrane protein [Rhodospirillales bacterium]
MCGLFFGGTASAQPLSDLIPELLKKDDLVNAARADLSAARERIRVTLGGWFPQLNVTGHYGYEKQIQPGADTRAPSRDLDISVTQLLWDFGSTNAQVRSASLVMDQANANLSAALQNRLLQAVTAYLNVIRTNEVLAFSKKSEGNIMKQTELENALVKRGAGFSTDVLQAKVQLAGAQARRVRATGDLKVARNAYREVFEKDAEAFSTMVKPAFPADSVPPRLDDAIEIALDNNPQLLAAHYASQIAKEDVNVTRASQFFPRFQAVAQSKFSKDVGGVLGGEQDFLGMVQFIYPFNLGFTAVNSLRASKEGVRSATGRFVDAKGKVEQQVRNAWDNLQTARENATLLRNQANIAAEFLELARKERKLGKRSLLDVLNGETNLVNAESDAASAERDVDIAVFTLLAVMGRLNAETVMRPSTPAR